MEACLVSLRGFSVLGTGRRGAYEEGSAALATAATSKRTAVNFIMKRCKV